jgi:mycofactocin precursor
MDQDSAAIDTLANEDAPAGEGIHELVEEELLIEEISIDGMCGVY